jgi:hypothetical protein
MKTKARVIAIYLPQYHPIPENDEVWGKGFTEWTNVAQAKPLFKGHYQPRIPKDFGFYDLRMSVVREMQAEYARKAGIEGFMYWQYYFGDDKKLLERPFEEVLASCKPDFPFCLGWANHSWQTKTWKRDANKKEGKTMIMEQLYAGETQYIEHFQYNLPAFKDHRYMTVDGKPIFVIWNPKDHSDEIVSLMKIWRCLAEKNGLPGIHFIGRQDENCSKDFLLGMGFDAIYQARENIAINGAENWTLMHRIRNRIEKIFDITININKADFSKNHTLLVNDDVKNNNVYPQLCAGYDRSPRAGRKAQMFYNFTPETWRTHIKNVLSLVKNKDYEHNIVMLKSWNEWGESNYIEPDLKYGTAMLDVLQEELEKYEK